MSNPSWSYYLSKIDNLYEHPTPSIPYVDVNCIEEVSKIDSSSAIRTDCDNSVCYKWQRRVVTSDGKMYRTTVIILHVTMFTYYRKCRDQCVAWMSERFDRYYQTATAVKHRHVHIS